MIRNRLRRAIKRAMNWAVKQGYTDRSPIAGFEKPPQGVSNSSNQSKLIVESGEIKYSRWV